MSKQSKKVIIAVVSPAVWGLLGYGIYSNSSVFIGAGAGLLAATFALLLTLKIKESSAEGAERRRIWKDGVDGTARILELNDTGARFNNHPRVELELEVTVADQPPYKAHCRALISELAIPRVQPDTSIKVKVDPADSSKLVVDAKLTPYGYK